VRLETFMFAESALAHAGRMFIHGGGVTRIDAPELPWTHPQLALVMRFEVEDGDEGVMRLGLRVADPDGDDVVPRGEVLFGPVELGDLAEGEPPFVNWVLTVSPLLLRSAGVYTFEIDVNGVPAGSERLVVVERPPAL
jgi:hypothetical protein